jgi:hypothetical protein
VTDPVETIRLTMDPAARAEMVGWREVVTAIGDIAAKPPSDQHEQVLVQLLSFDGPLKLASYGHLPHSQSPGDMITTAAIDALWRISGTTHAALCQQVAAGAVSPIVKRLVQARFPSAAAAAAAPDTAR